MAVASCAALHIPNTLTGTGQQVGRWLDGVHFLLAGAGLHVARVASRATVLVVLTANGMGQLAAGPTSTKARAAGLAHRAAGVLVTANVPGAVGWGSLAGRCLWQGGCCGGILPLTVPIGRARVAPRAAVLLVLAANCLWDRTAAPLPRCAWAAGARGGAAGEGVTGDFDFTAQGSWSWQAQRSWHLLHPWHLLEPQFTGALLCVALKPLRAAVYVVLTAHRLRERAAAPGS